MVRNQKINLITFIVLTGFISAFFYDFVLLSRTFLYSPLDRFNDFYLCVLDRLSYFPGEPSLAKVYPPFLCLFMRPFVLIGPTDISFLLYAALVVVIYAQVVFCKTRDCSLLSSAKNVYILLLMSYPFMFAFDRGNLELVVCLFILGFVLFHRTNPLLGSMFIAFATASKIYPAILLFVYIAERKWRYLFFSITITCIITLAALLVLPGGVLEQIQRLQENFSLYTAAFVIGDGGLEYGTSLYGLTKIVFYSAGLDFDRINLYRQYGYFVYLVTAMMLLFVSIEKIDYWKTVAILLFSACILPYVSASYKLLNVFPVLLLFVGAERARYDKWYCILLALLLIPKNYFRKALVYYPGSILDPLLLSLFVLLIIYEHFSQKRSFRVSRG